jgi:hypothetical protein
MNQEAVLWIFGVLITALSLASGGIIGFILSISTRMTALETFIKIYIKGAAEVLHNDDTPELDILLEKLVKSYHDHNYDLTLDEWQSLEKLSAQIKDDLTREPGKRLSASAIVALACLANDLSKHKLMRNIMP